MSDDDAGDVADEDFAVANEDFAKPSIMGDDAEDSILCLSAGRGSDAGDVADDLVIMGDAGGGDSIRDPDEADIMGDDAEDTSMNEQLQLALNGVEEGMSMRKSATTFGVPYHILRHQLKGKINGVSSNGRKPWLDQENENQLADWCLEMMKIGCPVSRSDVAHAVKFILDNKNIKMFPRDNLPSKNWVYKFFQRHPNISNRVPKHLAHKKADISYRDIDCFFNGLSEFLKNEYGMDAADFLNVDNASRIFNCDESVFFFNAADSGSKVLVLKGNKNANKRGGDGKLMMTVLFCVSALGDIVKPLIINKGKHPTLYESFKGLDRNSYAVAASDSGWMTADIFYSWLANILHQYLEEKNITRPVILFLDGYSSHISLETISFARSHDIIMYCLPPHASHIVQPLDVAVFRSVKAKYREVLGECRGTLAKTDLAKKNFPCVFMNAVKRSRIKENSVSGFEVTGIVPFNPLRIKQDKLLGIVEEQQKDIREPIVSQDQQECIVSQDKQEPTILEDLKAIYMARFKAGQSNNQTHAESIIAPYMKSKGKQSAKQRKRQMESESEETSEDELLTEESESCEEESGDEGSGGEENAYVACLQKEDFQPDPFIPQRHLTLLRCAGAAVQWEATCGQSTFNRKVFHCLSPSHMSKETVKCQVPACKVRFSDPGGHKYCPAHAACVFEHYYAPFRDEETSIEHFITDDPDDPFNYEATNLLINGIQRRYERMGISSSQRVIVYREVSMELVECGYNVSSSEVKKKWNSIVSYFWSVRNRPDSQDWEFIEQLSTFLDVDCQPAKLSWDSQPNRPCEDDPLTYEVTNLLLNGIHKRYERMIMNRKNSVYREVSEELMLQGHDISPEDVKSKWISLVTRYWSLQNQPNSQDWEYYKQLRAIMEGCSQSPSSHGGDEFSYRATKLLINCVQKKYNTLREKHHFYRSAIYKEICDELNSYGYNFVVKKVRRKWNNLLSRYRRIKKKDNITEEWDFFKPIDDMIDSGSQSSVLKKEGKHPHEAAVSPVLSILNEPAVSPEVIVPSEPVISPEIIVLTGSKRAISPELMVLSEHAISPELRVPNEPAISPELRVPSERAISPVLTVPSEPVTLVSLEKYVKIAPAPTAPVFSQSDMDTFSKSCSSSGSPEKDSSSHRPRISKRLAVIEDYFSVLKEKESEERLYRKRSERRSRVQLRILGKIGTQLEAIAKTQNEILSKQDKILNSVNQKMDDK